LFTLFLHLHVFKKKCLSLSGNETIFIHLEYVKTKTFHQQIKWPMCCKSNVSYNMTLFYIMNICAQKHNHKRYSTSVMGLKNLYQMSKRLILFSILSSFMLHIYTNCFYITFRGWNIALNTCSKYIDFLNVLFTYLYWYMKINWIIITLHLCIFIKGNTFSFETNI